MKKMIKDHPCLGEEKSAGADNVYQQNCLIRRSCRCNTIWIIKNRVLGLYVFESPKCLIFLICETLGKISCITTKDICRNDRFRCALHRWSILN